MPNSLLIEGGTVLTMGTSAKVLHDHSVLIEDGLVAKVAPRKAFRLSRGKRMDARGKVILPGFINAHTHFYSSLARGLTKTVPARTFNKVLKNLWWRLDSALTTEDCYYSALIALLGSIRHGTTTLVDHHASPSAVVGSLGAIERAVLESGLRACLCYELSDRDGAPVAEDGLAENAWFLHQCQQQPHARIRALFGLHASFTLSDDTLEKAAALGHELRTGFHIHVAEARSDQDHSKRHWGRRVVQRLKQFEILGPQSVAAHCIHVSPREMDLLAETRTAVIHNPQSNMNNAVGTANLVELTRHGALVGLGTDAMTTNMLEELRVALWGQHLRAGDPSVGFAETTATLFSGNPKIAQRMFGLRFGEIRRGAAADIAIFDYDPPTPLEPGNVYGHLVFGISQIKADSTIVGGRVLMERGNLALNLDEARVNARARELAKALWRRM
jgi:putative selenium metabolism protein SsnA